MKKVYLVLFNVISAAGWALVLFVTASALLAGTPRSEFWAAWGGVVRVVQSLAVLEVVHALTRITRSALPPTLIQVLSRLWPVWVVLGVSGRAQGHWSLYVMLGAWALVEVPRYLFYAAALIADSAIPYPLKWLRYSLFIVLYPLGISGELLQLWTALPALRAASLGLWYLGITVFALYLPGSPFLYFHMLSQRKSALAPRPPPAAAEEGIEFPITDPATGERSTLVLNKAAFAAAARAVSPDAAARVEREGAWRFRYVRHVVEHVRLALGSPEGAVAMAQAGLDYLHDHMEFNRQGRTLPLSKAMAAYQGTFETGYVKGTKPKAAPELVVPYQDKRLSGEALVAQLERWATYGTIEPEAREAIELCVRNPQWLDLSDRHFVLLGAGAAMGPLTVLLALGANVIAIDINIKAVWQRLLSMARDSPGSLTFPLSKPQASCRDEDDLCAAAGCNLFTQTPEVANWLAALEPGRPLVIGGYAYLDGARFIKVSVAMDAIMRVLSERRPPKSLTLAFLCTPTDCHVIPKAAYEAAQRNHARAPLWQKALEAVGVLKPNLQKPVQGVGGPFYLVDSITVAQGPNYILAKRLQHWRVVVARSQGLAVSANVAPSTATKSVLSNKQFAAAYVGLYVFKPMEVMYQDTSNAVMAALLIHDLRNPRGPAQPAFALANPLERFSYEGFHGGNWRAGYTMNSFGAPAFLIGTVMLNQPLAALLALAALAALAAPLALGLPHTWAWLL